MKKKFSKNIDQSKLSHILILATMSMGRQELNQSYFQE